MSNQADLDALTEQVLNLYPYSEHFASFKSIPAEGISREEILKLLTELRIKEDAMGDAGRVSGSIYHGGADHYEFLVEAFGNFAHSNVLQRDMYPSATKFEGEIVSMTASMLHGEDGVCGVITSGGTESLINPLLAYRERARSRGINQPEVIIPAFRPWFGYRFTVENSVYVASDSRGKGVAKLLMPPLINAAKELNLHAIVAGIEATNEASIALHEKFGFVEVAHFKEVGYKFNKWMDLKFLELILDEEDYKRI